MNKQIDELLQQKMDRKDFLKHVALAVVMMTGAASIVKTFHQPGTHTQGQSNGPIPDGSYGSSAYGGVRPVSSVR